jgi:hypothetical protein
LKWLSPIHHISLEREQTATRYRVWLPRSWGDVNAALPPFARNPDLRSSIRCGQSDFKQPLSAQCQSIFTPQRHTNTFLFPHVLRIVCSICITSHQLHVRNLPFPSYPTSVIPIVVNTTHALHAYLIFYFLATHRNECFFFKKKKVAWPELFNWAGHRSLCAPARPAL